MTDTPRTDAELWIAYDGRSSVGVVEADFARQLERDLAAARAEVIAANTRADAMFRVAEKWEAEAAALRVDAERYRWLREHGGKSYQETASQPTGMLPSIYVRFPSMNASGSYVLLGEQADAAIDQARGAAHE